MPDIIKEINAPYGYIFSFNLTNNTMYIYGNGLKSEEISFVYYDDCNLEVVYNLLKDLMHT